MSGKGFDVRRDASARLIDELTSACIGRIPAIRQVYPQFAGTSFPELEAFREAAAAMGLDSAREDLVALSRTDCWKRGLEHEVWRVDEAMVLKATYRNEFGFLPWGGEASPLQYLARLELCNTWFGDCIELVSVTEQAPGVVRVLTLQPFVDGDHPQQNEIDAFLSDLGFGRTEVPPDGRIVWLTAWGHRELCIGDLHSKNVIRTAEGGLAIIDGIVAAR